MANILLEFNTFDDAKIELLEAEIGKNKSLCMKGIFIQADVKNHNQRVYPLLEISNAVNDINKRIKETGPIPGEGDHPDSMTINIDRISHKITEMWMDGNNGMGKLVLLPTLLGNTVRVLLENGLKLGVSSRGLGEVDHRGNVSDFKIVTVDIVSQPSAPDAYPKTLYEQLLYAKNYGEIQNLGNAIAHDQCAQKYFQKEVITWFEDTLKRRK